MDERPGRIEWRTGIRFLSLAIFLFAFGRYVLVLLPHPVSQFPMAPLVVAPDLVIADALTTRPGALRGFDVILVTLDTTRPDRLGCYGHAGIETPNLDLLAREGVIFSAALATSSTTLPTHSSILTGLYPQHHGVRTNSSFRLDDAHQTLAETLSEAGYRTGAFVSAFVLDERFGLAQGFDVYDADVHASSGLGGFAERKADKTTDLAIRWIRKQRSAPYFLWIHYYDPHATLDPPSPFNERYAEPYDGEIAFVDSELGRLLQAVEEKRGHETLVVVVADHGEAMGEHGEQTHGYLLQEATLKIPMILYASSKLDRGVHVNTRVSQVDLMPTILSLLGVPAPRDLDGQSLTQAPARDRAVIAESAEGRVHYGWARLSAIYQGTLKYVHGPRPELYDLVSDPLERDDVFADREAEAAALRRLLDEEEGPSANDIVTSRMDLDAEDVRRLEALGYAVGGDVSPDTEMNRLDPKDMISVMSQMQALLSAYDNHAEMTNLAKLMNLVRGRPVVASRPELVRELEQLASDHPDFAPVHQYLGAFYQEEERPEDAERARQRFADLTGRS